MKKSISCAIFISDVGFGHMVRQRQIIFELKKKIRNIDITIFHQKNLNVIRKTFNKRVNYINNFNNIKLNKT
jgi:spore coat polysaccharide biosynthesis predicted glycosyltransferase SpsG